MQHLRPNDHDDHPAAAIAMPGRATAHDPTGRRRFLKTATALGLSLHGLSARAEPTTGRVLFGFALTPRLETMLNTIVAELHTRYRPDLGARPVFLPGNSGLVAMDAVIRAPSDGATALMSSSASMTLLPLVHKEAMDRVDQLQPIGGIGLFAYSFAVGPAVPLDVRTMKDYLSWTRVNPVLSTYGVLGRGTASHFMGTDIARAANMPLKSIAYKSLAALNDDVAKGNTPAGVTVVDNAMNAPLPAGVRLLAMSGSRRWPTLPDVPTLMELGLSDSPSDASVGFFISPRTPSSLLEDLRVAIRQTMEAPAVRASMDVACVLPMPANADYELMIYREGLDWKTRVAKYGFSADS